MCDSLSANSQTMARDDTGDGTSGTEESFDTEFIVVGQKCRNNKELNKAIESFGYPVHYSDTGFEHMNNVDYDTIFVVDNFIGGDIYQKLHQAGCRILGPPVIIRCAQKGERLPVFKRPVYSLTMTKIVLCFTGFKVKNELAELAGLAHHMGGSVRRDINASVTHLVANCTIGEKYRAAVSLDIPIMGSEWIHQCWEHRDNIDITANDNELITKNKLSPFAFTILSFYGFTPTEAKDMAALAESNGALVAEPGAPNCTHLVVEQHFVKQIPFKTMPKLIIVRSEWFWASIQVEARADESLYLFTEVADTPENGLQGGKTTPGSKTRKRKRDIKEKMAQLASEGQTVTPMYKRSSTEMAKLSFSGSFLDATVDTSAGTPLSEVGQRDNHQPLSPGPTPTTSHPKEPVTKLSARHERVRELFHTEKNYVGILHTILKVFKEGVEKPDQHGGPILDVQEIRTIFGGIPPIYDVHIKIRDSLLELLSNWKEDCLVGNVILDHVDDLCKAYPNFVNYFEQAKAKIKHCDKTKQRFHAFLKVCQSRSECGRQGLTDLLIRPIQRLPSIMLILKDILKKTDRSNPDYQKLELAISKLDEVTRHINEDRRIAEGHVAMFDIVHDIEDCPPSLLSAHRSFINRVDCIEVNDKLCGKGNSVTLFIFSDSLEVCKRRVRVLSSRSPAITHTPRTPQKAYKHLHILQFSEIKRVVNIINAADCPNVFALIAKKTDGKPEVMYAFALVEESINKEEFLTSLSKSICANLCRTDYETLMTTEQASDLNIDTSDLTNRSLSRAASKFGKRVSRVFSFSKTPRRLKRTISSMTQMMSPFHRENNIFNTPASSDLRAMRLASTNDLTRDESFFSRRSEKFDGNMTCSDLSDKMSVGSLTPVIRRRDLIASELPMSSMSRTPSTMSMDTRFLPSMGSTLSLNIR